jgi:tRNA A22 N-methylase
LEDDRFYPIIVIEKGEAEDLDYSRLFLGPRLIENRHPLLKKFYEFEKEKVLKNVAKMKKSKDPETEKKIVDILKKWEEMSRCIDEQ